MKSFKVFIVLVLAGFMSACSAPSYKGAPISDSTLGSNPEIVIVKDSETKEGFLDTIKQWLTKNGYGYEVKPDDSKHDLEKMTIEYVGHWKWDLALYLSQAEVEAFYKGQRVGEVNYTAANNLNFNKFSNDEERIEYMLDVLFGKLTPAEATARINEK